jgi:adenylate cyclase
MERRLTTILSADVVGYSRLMGEDEAGTLTALKALRRELVKPKEIQYRGRTMKLMGDGAVMEFAGVVDALAFAVEVQVAMAGRNAAVAEDRRIVYRIGLNVGDIVVEGDDISGDGVNEAARLEALCEPGGVCLSQAVLDQVKGKLDLAFEPLGEQAVENTAEPVMAYRVALDEKAAALTTPVVHAAPATRRRPWPAVAAGFALSLLGIAALGWWQPWTHSMDPALVTDTTVPLPDPPAIAVLPFENDSADPEQDYFADGMTEDLITDLAKSPGLQVTARTSTAAYKGRPVDVREISSELGVQYILEGSVEKNRGQIRVTAQLVEAATGNHLWAERFDRDLVDVFAIRDDIRTSIVGAITGRTAPQLTAEIRKAKLRPLDSLRARDLYYRALSYFSDFHKDANAKARNMLEKSIALDPDDAAAHALLAWTHWRDTWLGWGDDPEASRDLALKAAKQAVALDDADYRSHWALAAALHLPGDDEAAAAHYQRAFELNPHDPDLLADWGAFLRYSGRAEDAVAQVQRAMALNPHYPAWYISILTDSYFQLGRYRETVEVAGTLVNPLFDHRLVLAASYANLGRTKEAEAEIAKILEIDPDYTIASVPTDQAWEGDVLERLLDGLRKAGLPE